MMVRFHVKSARVARTNDAMKELRKCGILCRRCHTKYDGHFKYDWPKADFHDAFTAGGATETGANWEQWRLEPLTVSEAFDHEIAGLLG